MMPASLLIVATGDGSASRPSASVPTCHNATSPTMRKTLSSAGGMSRPSARSAVTSGSASCAAGIEPALPCPEDGVDAADKHEQQHDQPVHHAVVERVVRKRDRMAHSGARHHELARNH